MTSRTASIQDDDYCCCRQQYDISHIVAALECQENELPTIEYREGRIPALQLRRSGGAAPDQERQYYIDEDETPALTASGKHLDMANINDEISFPAKRMSSLQGSMAVNSDFLSKLLRWDEAVNNGNNSYENQDGNGELIFRCVPQEVAAVVMSEPVDPSTDLLHGKPYTTASSRHNSSQSSHSSAYSTNVDWPQTRASYYGTSGASEGTHGHAYDEAVNSSHATTESQSSHWCHDDELELECHLAASSSCSEPSGMQNTLADASTSISDLNGGDVDKLCSEMKAVVPPKGGLLGEQLVLASSAPPSHSLFAISTQLSPSSAQGSQQIIIQPCDVPMEVGRQLSLTPADHEVDECFAERQAPTHHKLGDAKYGAVQRMETVVEDSHSLPSRYGKASISVLPFETAPVEQLYARAKEEVGRGEFGVVRPCMLRSTGRVFACKTVNKSRLVETERIEDLEMELYCMGVMPSHANIVQLHSVHEDLEEVHMVMEMCDGGDLFELVAKQGHLAEPTAACIFRQAVEAVAFCHFQGVAHLDIKPENLLIFSKGMSGDCFLDRSMGDRRQAQMADIHVKLADFGQAVLLEPSQMAQGLAGSSLYMAPEVVCGKPYSFPADVWSLGVLLYVILAGYVPFWGEDVQHIFVAICCKDPDLSSPPWHSISAEAKHLVRLMLNPDPNLRPTATEVLSHPWLSEQRHKPHNRQGTWSGSAFGFRSGSQDEWEEDEGRCVEEEELMGEEVERRMRDRRREGEHRSAQQATSWQDEDLGGLLKDDGLPSIEMGALSMLMSDLPALVHRMDPRTASTATLQGPCNREPMETTAGPCTLHKEGCICSGHGCPEMAAKQVPLTPDEGDSRKCFLEGQEGKGICRANNADSCLYCGEDEPCSPPRRQHSSPLSLSADDALEQAMQAIMSASHRASTGGASSGEPIPMSHEDGRNGRVRISELELGVHSPHRSRSHASDMDMLRVESAVSECLIHDVGGKDTFQHEDDCDIEWSECFPPSRCPRSEHIRSDQHTLPHGEEILAREDINQIPTPDPVAGCVDSSSLAEQERISSFVNVDTHNATCPLGIIYDAGDRNEISGRGERQAGHRRRTCSSEQPLVDSQFLGESMGEDLPWQRQRRRRRTSLRSAPCSSLSGEIVLMALSA